MSKNWKLKHIKELGRVITGKTPPKAEARYFEGEYLFVSPKDLDYDLFYVHNTETKISEEALKKFKNQVLPPNSIMFTSLSYSFGKIGIAKERCLTNQQINSIVVNRDNDYKYVYYLLRASEPFIFQYNSGIDTPIVPKSVFEKIKLLVPPVHIQQHIASILSAYDDLIEVNNQRIKLLEETASQLYKEWFVRMRFPGYKETKFEKGLPFNWEIKKVSDLLHRRKFGKTYRPEELEESGKVIVIDQSTDDLLGYHNNNHDHAASFEKPMIIFGDHTCKMQLMVEPFSLAENVIPIFSRDHIPIYFLFYLINSLVETTEYRRHWNELTSKSVLLAKEDLQIKYSELVMPFFKQINILKKQNTHLRQIRDRLLPRLISGKLQIKAPQLYSSDETLSMAAEGENEFK